MEFGREVVSECAKTAKRTAHEKPLGKKPLGKKPLSKKPLGKPHQPPLLGGKTATSAP
jgi:hypothetical protein